MKRTRLKRVGRIGRANIESNVLLRATLGDIGHCEASLDGCLGTMYPTNAHRHKRSWYKGDVEKLSDYKQVIRICVNCHNTIEHNEELTKQVFQKLRGDE